MYANTDSPIFEAFRRQQHANCPGQSAFCIGVSRFLLWNISVTWSHNNSDCGVTRSNVSPKVTEKGSVVKIKNKKSLVSFRISRGL